MQFINAQTGWITLFNPTNFIKTTNGGNNWIIQQAGSDQFEHFEFLNDTLGFATGHIGASGQVSKTTNGGINWVLLYTGSNYFSNLSFINNDTGYFCGTDGNFAGIWRTTNGGTSITRIFTTNFFTIEQILFLKQKYEDEYYGWWLSSGFMSKTTNSGFTWSTPIDSINGQTGNFKSLFFLDKDTGWIIFDPNLDNTKILKTFNQGVDWTVQYYDTNNNYTPTKIEGVNTSDVWAGNGFWNMIHASSNGGNVWGRQSSPIFRPAIIEMADSLNGWVGLNNLCHTTDGGGIITYVGIDPSNTEVPIAFQLKQNYPNPFNPQTTIEFSIKQNSNVSLRLYDILGKEIIRIYDNENLQAGNYKAVLDFSKKDLSSGTYFYTLTVNDGHSGHLFRDTKKLMYLK